jgi:hypothetical protein
VIVVRPWNVLPGNVGCAPTVVQSPTRAASARSLGFACMQLLSSHLAEEPTGDSIPRTSGDTSTATVQVWSGRDIDRRRRDDGLGQCDEVIHGGPERGRRISVVSAGALAGLCLLRLAADEASPRRSGAGWKYIFRGTAPEKRV